MSTGKLILVIVAGIVLAVMLLNGLSAAGN